MSNTLMTSLRPALRSAAAWSTSSPIASSSTSPLRSFSSSSPAYVSRAKVNAKRKKAANLALRAQRQSADSTGVPDPVLGYVIHHHKSSSRSASALAPSSSSPSNPGEAGTNPWDGCRLQRTLLVPEQIWSSLTPSSSASPEHYLPGLSQVDRDLLFGALPHTTLTLTAHTHGDLGPEEIKRLNTEQGVQERSVNTMKRILDLRNASRKGIEVVNRERILNEFGLDANGIPQSGSSEVQAALLTMKIRNLHQHLQQNSRDIANRRSLRSLVHERAKVLKYLKKSQPTEYDRVLLDLGLERRGVEGEITM